MQHQNQNQPNYQSSNQLPPQLNDSGHSLFETRGAIGAVVGMMDQHLLYKAHMKDQELITIAQRHQTFLTQLYNTLVDTLKSGEKPAVPTQTYQMQQSNEVIYGLQPTAPISPSQSANEVTDQCVAGFMLGGLKSLTSSFSMAALEATNPVLRRVFADSVPNIIEMAYDVFLYQNKKHYYQVPQLQPEHMQTLINSFAPSQGNTVH